MKRCPQCNRTEADEALGFCRLDGTPLVNDSDAVHESSGTLKLSPSQNVEADKTRVLPPDTKGASGASTTQETPGRPTAQTTVLVTPVATGETRALSKPKSRKASVVVVAAIIVVALIACAYLYWSRGKNAVPIESIAVMPFVNASGNADVEYLADGITESLINNLSQLPNLLVKARSTVFHYKGKDVTPQQVGSELSVQAVLNGRVVQRSEQLTLSLELVDARTGDQIWGEQYNRKQTDLVSLQSEIARDVSDKLRVKLSGADEQKLTKKYTENAEAYQLYLKGRYHYAKMTKDDIRRGIEYFNQAISLDPNFALAYVAIADSYNSIPSFTYLSPKEAIPQAKAAAERALEIDPTLAEAHTALATSITEYDRDWAKAEREFKRALELNPNNSGTHFLYAVSYLLPVGRTDEAITKIKRAVELEPLELILSANLAAAYMYARQNDRALEQARKTYDLEPNFVGGRIWLATVYNANGMYDDAIALCEKSLQSDPTNQPFLTLAGYGYAKAGRRREAEEIIKRWKDIAKTQYVSHYWIATIYTALGERDEAFAQLEKAFEERDYFLPRLKIEPFIDPLRDDPRYKDLVQRMGLPE